MHPRTRFLLLPVVATLVAACASSGASEGTAGTAGTPSPAAGSGTVTLPASTTWPVKTRMHLDLWLHGFAMVQDDTATVPYFKRGYREALIVRRNAAGVGQTALDANREVLRKRFRDSPQLVGAQFLGLQVSSWEELRQVTTWFLEAQGDPRRAGSRDVAAAIAGVAAYFPAAADREWLRVFMLSLEDERTKFYQSYWTQAQRERGPVLAAIDSAWQRVARPQLQGYLNNTQLANGELVASLPIDGEGRTITGGKRVNVVVTNFPERREDAMHAVYTFVHEATLGLAATAVNDETTPAEKRSGVVDRYTASAAVIAGHLVLRRLAPELADGYARYYLQSAGRPVPSGSPVAALDATFAVPAAIRAAIVQQIGITLGGI